MDKPINDVVSAKADEKATTSNPDEVKEQAHMKFKSNSSRSSLGTQASVQQPLTRTNSASNTGNGSQPPSVANSLTVTPTRHKKQLSDGSISVWSQTLSENSPLADSSNSSGAKKSPPHKSKNKKFHKIFPDISADELIVDYFSCAYVSDILLQGNLFITPCNIGFYSNVFGYITKILMPVNSVVKITKERTAKIIPNAVGIETAQRKYVFGSLLSRETTFRLLTRIWEESKTNDLATHEGNANELRIVPPLTASNADDAYASSGSGYDGLKITPGGSRVSSSESGPDHDSVIYSEKVPPSTVKNSNSQAVRLDSAPNQNRSDHSAGGLASKPNSVKGGLTNVFGLIQNTDTSSLFLFICTLLLVFLFLSAGVLLYRLGQIQQQFMPPVPNDGRLRNFEEAYRWQQRLHALSIGEMKESLHSYVRHLEEVRKSMEAIMVMIGPPDGEV